MAVIATKLKKLGEMHFNQGGGVVNWFPGHMAVATRAIRDRLKLSDLVVEVRDARIPLSSANLDFQPVLARKRRILVLNKKDLANPNIMRKWAEYFQSHNQDCLPINAHSRNCVRQLLDLIEVKLKEVISSQPTLLVMVIGVPNVGKSALINSINQIASSRFPVQDKMKKAKVGPLPGVTQDISGFKIAQKPSIYVLDTPGVLVPSIPDIETGLKLALAGSVKDSVVGEDRIARYLLAVLNIRNTPRHWSRFNTRRIEDNSEPKYSIQDLLPKTKRPVADTDMLYIKDVAREVQRVLYVTHSEFNGNMDEEDGLESLIEQQFEVLQKALKIPQKRSEARIMVAKKLLALFRAGKLGPYIFDDVPQAPSVAPHTHPSASA